MKNAILLLVAIVMCLTTVNAQWTNDSNNPQAVCTAACTQGNVAQVADGNGGTFVFWIDSRTSCWDTPAKDVYGQHYNAAGAEQWESGGREILNYGSGVTGFAVMRSASDGEMIIGAHITGSGDSLLFQKLDDQGAKVWANDLLAAKFEGCTGTYILGIENFSFLRDDSGYVVVLTPVYCGGADGNRITRFNSSGMLTGPFNGEPEGNQYYVGARGIQRTYDGSNDVYLFYTDGNGLGAHARAMRLNMVGDTVWAPFDVLSGTNGLNYQYGALSDESGLGICYGSTGPGGTQDIFLRRVNGNGSWDWGGNTITICDALGSQSDFSWTQDTDFYYVVWADGRPGVVGYYAVYAQKVEKATGNVMWGVNGTQVINVSSYSPSPECLLRSDGKLLVSNLSTNVDFGFNAVLLNSDGSQAWDAPAIMCHSNYSPFYHDYQIIESGPNTIIAWAKSNPAGGADDIYISKLVEPTVPCPQDLNDDGVINTADLLLFMGSFGCVSSGGDPDLNNDGVVNTADLLLFMGAFGSSCP